MPQEVQVITLVLLSVTICLGLDCSHLSNPGTPQSADAPGEFVLYHVRQG